MGPYPPPKIKNNKNNPNKQTKNNTNKLALTPGIGCKYCHKCKTPVGKMDPRMYTSKTILSLLTLYIYILQSYLKLQSVNTFMKSFEIAVLQRTMIAPFVYGA